MYLSRTALTAAFVVEGAMAASAQEPGGVRSAVVIAQERATVSRMSINTPIVVVDRLLSFDTDRDARIAKAELPERMEGLFHRGDTNQDGFLDSNEIRAVISAEPPFFIERAGIRRQGPEGLAGVISDLRLAPEKHDKALAIVARAPSIPRNVNDATTVDVHARMKELLNDEEYENFVAAANRLTRGPNAVVGGRVFLAAPPPPPPPRP